MDTYRKKSKCDLDAGPLAASAFRLYINEKRCALDAYTEQSKDQTENKHSAWLDYTTAEIKSTDVYVTSVNGHMMAHRAAWIKAMEVRREFLNRSKDQTSAEFLEQKNAWYEAMTIQRIAWLTERQAEADMWGEILNTQYEMLTTPFNQPSKSAGVPRDLDQDL